MKILKFCNIYYTCVHIFVAHSFILSFDSQCKHLLPEHLNYYNLNIVHDLVTQVLQACYWDFLSIVHSVQLQVIKKCSSVGFEPTEVNLCSLHGVKT